MLGEGLGGGRMLDALLLMLLFRNAGFVSFMGVAGGPGS